MNHKMNLEVEVIDNIGEDAFNHDYSQLDLVVEYNQTLDDVVVSGLSGDSLICIGTLESLLEDMKYIKSKAD